MRIFTRAVTVLGLLLASSTAAVAQPAWACGCGAMIADSSVRVSDETSIVRYDAAARTEEIVMRLSAESSAKDAAWLFPTPSEAEVRLGERGWFEELDELTEPRVVTRRIWFPDLGGGFGAGDGAAPAAGAGGGVEVLGERDLGPFRVATLDADDPDALAGWLSRNGYRLRPDLEKALGPYVEQGWKYVAVKLRPSSGAPLTGALDPLHVSFASDELVYPMRLSGLAENTQRLHLYVLGEHRVEQTTGERMRLTFAGRVTPEQVGSAKLREFLGDGLFMTELLDGRIDPEEIDDDYRFTATDDEPYRQVVYRREVVRFLGVPAGWLLVLAAGGLVVAVGAGLLVHRRSRRT
ncbi:hypothetical protein BJF79_06820 [Actinomadura sp. CNU-125]|uniref:DUF2330 domain-containing protein n=1 Tax=Actinomadura sp. CNU-125 TaxID=1904961 RepID=UPI00095D9AED|nr:DUF2330 domain-containing protein [Actinomadura sp. CNU-125]OLT36314.1 hypothetical protein BJF79_06820 [Actinomadura sp. CNU-125]